MKAIQFTNSTQESFA